MCTSSKSNLSFTLHKEPPLFRCYKTFAFKKPIFSSFLSIARCGTVIILNIILGQQIFMYLLKMSPPYTVLLWKLPFPLEGVPLQCICVVSRILVGYFIFTFFPIKPWFSLNFHWRKNHLAWHSVILFALHIWAWFVDAITDDLQPTTMKLTNVFQRGVYSFSEEVLSY